MRGRSCVWAEAGVDLHEKATIRNRVIQPLLPGDKTLSLLETRPDKPKRGIVPLAGATVDLNGEEPTLLNHKIVECAWNSERGVWVFMRVRTDKDTPNAYHVYEKAGGGDGGWTAAALGESRGGPRRPNGCTPPCCCPTPHPPPSFLQVMRSIEDNITDEALLATMEEAQAKPIYQPGYVPPEPSAPRAVAPDPGA